MATLDKEIIMDNNSDSKMIEDIIECVKMVIQRNEGKQSLDQTSKDIAKELIRLGITTFGIDNKNE